MSWKMRVLVLAMLFAPPVALPLGLGEIRLGSALNEPLSAEIDLVAATPEELGDLQAHLASRELFQRYGLDRPAYLDSLEFRVGRFLLIIVAVVHFHGDDIVRIAKVHYFRQI